MYSRLSFAPLLRFARMRGGCIRRLHNYCLCSSFFSSLNSFNSSRSSCYFYYASGGFTFFDCNVLVLEIIILAGLRTEILGLKIEITFSWLTFSFKSCRFQAWQKFVLLRGGTTASLKFGKLWQNLVDLKITGRTCLRQLVTNFFALSSYHYDKGNNLV